MPDFYEVLQVQPSAEREVVRAAYRVLARKYHPDHGGDARRMIALNDAWDVLGDPTRRAAYDASRETQRRRAAPGGEAQAAAGENTFGAAPRSEPWAAPAATADATRAGPPPGRPSGTVLDFGRYAGWSLGEIARYDRDYLEWLQRATFGRRLRAEIDILLRQRGPDNMAGGPSGQPWRGHR
jgi:curved DNA-binding protein CbpA